MPLYAELFLLFKQDYIHPEIFKYDSNSNIIYENP